MNSPLNANSIVLQILFFYNIKEWTIFNFYKIKIFVYFQYVGRFNELKKIEIVLILVKSVQS